MDPLEIFKALKLSNNTPDFKQRRLQLNSLIPNLKPSERFKLQQVIEDFWKVRKGNNFFKRLPLEVRLTVVENIYLEDLLRLRLICRSWYQVFCDAKVCAHAIKRYFPNPLDYYYNQSILHAEGIEGDKIREEWLRKFIINRIRRENGIASRTYHLDYNIDLDTSKIEYCNGRVVIKQENGFTVQDLVTKQRYLLEHPGGVELKDTWHVSDRYLLAVYVNRERSEHEVAAWNLISKQFYLIRMIVYVHSMTAFQDQVGLITSRSSNVNKTFDLRIWTIGYSFVELRKVQIDKNSSAKKIVKADVFFHKIEKDAVFLIYHSLMKSDSSHKLNAIKITAEFFKAGELMKTQYEIKFAATEFKNSWNFMITNDSKICIDLWKLPDLYLQTLYEHLTYDMTRKQFECEEIYLHPDSWNQVTYYKSINLVWRDQIYAPVLRLGRKGLQVITISKSVSDIWFGTSENATNPSFGSARTSISYGETRPHSSAVEIDKSSIDFCECRFRVWGDDGYLLAISGKGLRVWEFDAMGLRPSNHPLGAKIQVS